MTTAGPFPLPGDVARFALIDVPRHISYTEQGVSVTRGRAGGRARKSAGPAHQTRKSSLLSQRRRSASAWRLVEDGRAREPFRRLPCLSGRRHRPSVPAPARAQVKVCPTWNKSPGPGISPDDDRSIIEAPLPAPKRFEQLALPHLDAAYSLAFWLMRDRADAEDVVQDAYIRAFAASMDFAARQSAPGCWRSCATWRGARSRCGGAPPTT